MKKKYLKAKVLSVIMAASMVFSLCPTGVFGGQSTEAIVQADSSFRMEKPSAENEYTYCYAALTYAEYYDAEDVYAAGDATSSNELDSHNETDKGAFDAVSRATTNHGLHRGNFQGDVTIYDTDGSAYRMSYWKDSSTIVLVDGTEIGFSRGAITKADGTTAAMKNYQVTGIKYVPVAVKTSDYETFKTRYQVVENGDTLAGGYSENKLESYSVTAAVDKDTNGLKTAVKNSDGTFSFGARSTGTTSGIQDQELKTISASDLGVAIQETSSYGDFLRVDFKDNYGGIAANLQAVVWDYYGDGDTVIESYGTKFAADNWMHKSNGIQLGLTDSLRCQIPEGYDGTGKWILTVYALGYADTAVTLNVTEDDIRLPHPVSDTSALEKAIADAKALTASSYTTESWAAMHSELEEAEEVLALAVEEGKTTQEAVEEAAEHLNLAISELDVYVYGTVNLPYADFYYGELNAVAESARLNLTAADKVTEAGYREAGQYDAVSSATTSKSTRFGTTYYSQTDSGVEILGIKDVNIAVPKKLYDMAVTAAKSGETCNNQVLDIVSSMTVAEDGAAVPAEYKVLNGDGTLTAMVTTSMADNSAAASITTNSRYGDYQITVTSDYLPTTDDMFGVVVETASGKKYGMAHLENLWLRTGEIAFAVTDNFVEPHGNTVDSERYKSIVGETITRITYLVKDSEDIVIETSLKCKQLLDKDYQVTGSNAVYADGASVEMEVKAPDDSAYKLTSVTFGGRKLTPQTDYTYENSVLTIKETENTGIGQYSLTYTDDTYEDMTATVIFTSTFAEGSVTIKDNKLVLPEGLELSVYLNSIAAVSVDGRALRAPGNPGTTIFNADGSVNFDAEISSRGGKTIVFPNADTEYTLAITAIGYPSVTAKVKSPKEVVSTEKPSTEEPSTEKPSAEEPATPKPSAGEPGTQQPGMDMSESDTEEAPEKGDTVKDGKVSYKVTKAKSAVEFVSTGSMSATVKIPATVKISGITYKVTSVAAGAFKNNKKITDIVIGKNVTTIGANAFSGCKKLKSVTIGANVKKIGKEAFKGDSKLATITIKSTKLSSVGKNAFKGIKATAKIKVPKSKHKAYQKLLKGKGQGSKVKLT